MRNEELVRSQCWMFYGRVSVTDDETEAALRACFADTHNVVEGAAAAGLAAVFKDRAVVASQRVGLVLTGGNIDTAVLARVLAAK